MNKSQFESMPSSFKEKDKVVKIVLKHLFSNIESIVFKGGTALSLIHESIERFSEDLDISFDSNIINTKSKVKRKLEEVKNELMTISEENNWSVNQEGEDDNISFLVEYKSLSEESEYDQIITPGSVKVEPQTKKRMRLEDFSICIFEGTQMNVQTKEAILSEKICLLFENLYAQAKTKNFNSEWLFRNDTTNSRHLYDVYTLSMAGVLPNKSVIRERILRMGKGGIIFSNEGTFREQVNKDILKSKDLNIASFLNGNMSIFKRNFKASKDEIYESIESIVFPFNKNKMKITKLTNIIEKYFLEILRIINSPIKQKK